MVFFLIKIANIFKLQEKNMNQIHAVGIIAEYNPFHNGHFYHIQMARQLTHAPYCIAVISGDFVQRGAPAMFEKYTRARMALLSGADLVLELPPVFATASAEDFAACGVALLDRLGVVSHLCFGSEWGESSLISKFGTFLAREPEELSFLIKKYVSLGYSFPEARQSALTDCLSIDPALKPHIEAILSSPNNLLGVEYCKALARRSSSIIPVTLPRKGSGYDDKELADNYSSATAIRSRILKDYSGSHDKKTRYSAVSGQIPSACLSLLEDAAPLTANDFSSLLAFRLLELHHQGIPFHEFADVSRDLSARMEKQLLNFSSFEDKAAALKTKQYTYTRISRCLIHILLDMTARTYRCRKEGDYISYVRILGFKREAAPLLSAIKKASALPLITKTADAKIILDTQTFAWFEQDLLASHIYQSVLAQKSEASAGNEYTRSVIVI